MEKNGTRTLVVTGGAGFIGSALIRHLNDLGMDDIVIVDDLGTDEKWKNLVGKRFLDLVPIDACFKWIEGRDVAAIFHLGACADTTETDADFFLRRNTKFSMRLAKYAVEHKARFIYASSAATYGDGGHGFLDDHASLHLLRPLNIYGYSKHLFDLWLQRHGFLRNVVGLKYFNVFGPNEGHKGRMSSIIPHMLPDVLQGNAVRLFKSDTAEYADGEQRRDFVYVKDVVKMTAAFLHTDACGIYNVGTGEATTWNRLVSAIFKAAGKPCKIDYIPMPKDLEGKYQNYTQADMAKTQSVLGDVARCRSCEDAVADYVNDHLISGELW